MSQRQIDVIPHTSAATRERLRGHTLVVVDTLRATSTIAALLDRGVAAVYPVPTVGEAEVLRSALGPGALLCGERGGLPPVGFDCGNSPVEIERIDLEARTAVLTTSNGTLALQAGWQFRTEPNQSIFAAALVNAKAVLRAALAAGRDIAILCAGERGGTIAAEEDLYTAGYIARAAAVTGVSLSVEAAGAVAMVEGATHPAKALPGFRHARELAALGLAADIEWCSRADVLEIVPVLRGDGAGIPHLVPMR